MSNKVKDFIYGVIAVIILTAAMGGCLYHATSPESWYAGMHDSKCGNTLYGEKCHCYERFLEADKERTGK